MAFRKQDTSSEFVKKEDLKDGFMTVVKMLSYVLIGLLFVWVIAGTSSRFKPSPSTISIGTSVFYTSNVEISVYNPLKGQTDSTPLHTFCGDTISIKDSTFQDWIAISPDIFKEMNLSCGDSVTILCGDCPYDEGRFKIVDKTHTKIKGRVDVLEHGNVSSGLYKGTIIHRCK